MIKSLVKVAAVLSAAVLLLTGCAQNSPSVAATVGSSTITVAEVDAAAKAVAAHYPAAAGESARPWGEYRSLVLSYMIHKQLLAMAAQVSNQQISDQQLAALVNSDSFIRDLANDPASRDIALALVLMDVAKSSQSMQTALTQVIAGVPVEVNPVFGVWDPSQATFSSNSGSLSVSLTQS